MLSAFALLHFTIEALSASASESKPPAGQSLAQRTDSSTGHWQRALWLDAVRSGVEIFLNTHVSIKISTTLDILDRVDTVTTIPCRTVVSCNRVAIEYYCSLRRVHAMQQEGIDGWLDGG
jgi:hypothetical protein